MMRPSPRARSAHCNWTPAASSPMPAIAHKNQPMRTMMRQLQAWSAPYRRAAVKYADLVEPLFAIALCGLLEGLLRQRSDAPPELAARLTLGLFVAAPVMLAVASAGYLKSSAARLRAQRPAIALYRVLGGSMARASAQQALLALLPRWPCAQLGALG